MDPQRAKTEHDAALSKWLEDDDSPKLLYAAVDPSTIGKPAPPAQPKQKTTVQIDIRLPKLSNVLQKLRVATQHVPRPHVARIPRERILAAFATIAVIAVVGSIGRGLMTGNAAPTENKQTGTKATSVAAESELTKPTFTVMVPQGKPQLGEVGRKETAYDGTRNTFSFIDAIQGTQITVSEQPIPDTFGSPEEAATKVAKSVRASDPINTAKGKAFIATDAKGNAQTVVYSVNDLLIFVQSPFKKDVSLWKTYLDQLQ